MGRRRSSVVWRVVLALLAVVVLLPVLAVAGALVFVDPNAWRPRIEAAALQATGRALTLGRLSLVPALSPTVAAEDVALANLPGGSRPAMATVARAEVTLALLPLVLGRVEVARVVLLRPDVLLERDDRGTPNWRFARAEAPAGTASPDAGTGRTGGGWSEILVRSLRIEDGRVVWRDRGTGAATTVAIRQLDAGAPDWTAPVTLTGQGSVQRGAAPEALVLTAETGPLARLLDAAAATPWPVNATLEAPGARLTMNGTATRPLEGRGIAATVAGAAVSLSALDGLLQTRLPALRQVGFTGRVDDAGGGAPRLSALALRAGASDLDALVPGLQVARAELSAAGLDQPMQAEAEGTLAGAPLHLTAALGPPASLLWAAPGPFPVDIAAQALGGTITLKGALATPAALAGVDLAVAARLPDLAALSPLVGRPLPALGPVALDARVGDRDGGGIGQGLAIHGLAVTTPAGDLAGDGAVGFGARPSVQATLSSRRIDADAIAAAMPPPTPLSPAPPPAAGTPPAPAAGPARRIPDVKLPFAGLGRFDAELRLAVAELLSGGVTTSDFAATVVLRDGKLAVDPVTGTLPGGRLELRLDVDEGVAPPPVSLVMHAPGLALKPLLAALRLPDDATGTVEIDADLRGAGDTPRALAATLSGRLGVAMADGELDNRLLGLLLGELLRAAKLPVDVVGLAGARTRVHCLAARIDARDGIAKVGTLVLDAGKLLLEGGGTVNLRDEGLSLRLRPLLRVGAPVVVPVRVGGTFAAPKFGSDAGGVAGGLAGLAAGLLGGRGKPAGERGGDACPAALAAARAGGGR